MKLVQMNNVRSISSVSSIDIFQYPVIRWIHDIVFIIRSFETEQTMSDMILLLHLTSRVFENCEREALQGPARC